MAARRSVWSDARVQDLAARFVPAADEVSRLQRGEAADGAFFRRFCEEGHYGGRTQPTATRQGIYAAAPSGRFLASVNSRRAADVAAMLERALEAWRKLGEEQRRLDAETREALAAVERWRDRYPEDGLVLAVTTRDLRDGEPDDADWRAHAWNLDQAWFRRDEMRGFVPDAPRAGARHDVPEILARRLARCHLLDNVRGQTLPFPDECVETARLTAHVVAVDGDLVQLRYEGRTRARQSGRWPVEGFRDRSAPRPQERGFETELRGTATFDRAAQRFTAFELIARGTRWGATQYNMRGDDRDPSPIGVVLRLVDDPDAPRVTPAHIWSYGWRR